MATKEKTAKKDAKESASKPKKEKKAKVVDVEIVGSSKGKELAAKSEVADQATIDAVEHLNEYLEDLMFKSMSKAAQEKYKLNADDVEIGEQLESANTKMGKNRTDFAICMTRLVSRQLWKKSGYSPFDYFHTFHKIDWSKGVRYANAARMLVLTGRDASTLDNYYYDRLDRYYRLTEKGVATLGTFNDDEDKMLLEPKDAANIMRQKDFDHFLKQKFGSALAALKAEEDGENPDDAERRYAFTVKQFQAEQIDETYRVALERSRAEKTKPPSQGDHFYMMSQAWMAEHDLGAARATRIMHAFEAAFGVALLPFPIHKHDKLPEGLEGLALFEHKGAFCIEVSKKHASKFFGCKVDEVKLKVANVTHYLERIGSIKEATPEEKEAAAKVLGGTAATAKESSAPQKEKVAKGEKKEKKEKPAKRRITDLSDDEVKEKVIEYRERLGLSAEDVAALGKDRSLRKVLQLLVVQAKNAGK